MSTAIAQAFENRTAGTQRQRREPATKPVFTPRSAAQIKADRQTRLANMLKRATAERSPDVVEAIMALFNEERDLTAAIRERDTARRSDTTPEGSYQYQTAVREIAEFTSAKTQAHLELEYYRKEYPADYDDAVRQDSVQRADAEYAETLRIDPTTVRAGDIRSYILSAVDAKLIGPGNTFSWDKTSYGGGQTAEALAALIAGFQLAKEDEDAGMIAELRKGGSPDRKGFYISAKRGTDKEGIETPSELDLLRGELKLERSPSKFLNGAGVHFITRVGYGFVVLEHKEGKTLAIKTSDVKAGRDLFTLPRNGTRVARTSPPEINPDGPISATDLKRVWHNKLRESLEHDVQREAESTERRGVADGLRDVSQVKDPITFYELTQLGKVGTWVVDCRIGNKEAGEREEHVTLHVIGLENDQFVLGQFVEGVLEKVDPDSKWLRRAVNPQPRRFLKNREWRDFGKANAWHERDWQLDREATRLNAVVVTNENVQDVVNVDGKDGTYAFATRDRRTNKYDQARPASEPVKEWFVPVGFIVKRVGQTIEFVWGVPGASQNKLEKFNGVLNVNELPPTAKAMFINLLYSVHRREDPKVEVPVHLQRQQQTQE